MPSKGIKAEKKGPKFTIYDTCFENYAVIDEPKHLKIILMNFTNTEFNVKDYVIKHVHKYRYY